MFKRLILCLFLFTYFQTTAFAEQRSFLSDYAKSILESSNEVKANPLAKMKFTPRIISPFDPKSPENVTLTKKQKNKLISLIKTSKDINPKSRLGTCKYDPGVSFIFLTKSEKAERQIQAFTILLCFNCDLWAIGSNTMSPLYSDSKQIVAFGDNKEQREELISLVKEIFGEDFFK